MHSREGFGLVHPALRGKTVFSDDVPGLRSGERCRNEQRICFAFR
ncbi:MAG: hypothetical protein ABFR90_07220 [Planctomycetota bacterium]